MKTQENLAEFLDAIGYGEQPMAMFYTNREPEGGFSPGPAELPTVDKEQSGQIDWGAVFGDFSCIIGNIWRARRKSSLAWFSAERFGCPGGAFYLGFLKPQTDTIAHYVSTGIPGVFNGERYIDSPENSHAFFQAIDPLPAAARYCVFKPLDQLETTEEPEVVMFFARPEVLVGLHTLAMFVTNDIEAVATPFGAGCSHIVTWPRRYGDKGLLKAALGGWDPSCRKYYKTDELSFAVPNGLFGQILERWRESFLITKTWQLCMKKVALSEKTWSARK